MSLFEKLGGFAAVSKVVNEFYDEAVDNPITAPYFEGMQMDRLIDHQVKFLSQALGGPSQYTGQAMGAAHSRLKITEEAFNEVGRMLSDVLEDNGVSGDDLSAIMELAGSLKDEIVAT